MNTIFDDIRRNLDIKKPFIRHTYDSFLEHDAKYMDFTYDYEILQENEHSLSFKFKIKDSMTYVIGKLYIKEKKIITTIQYIISPTRKTTVESNHFDLTSAVLSYKYLIKRMENSNNDTIINYNNKVLALLKHFHCNPRELNLFSEVSTTMTLKVGKYELPIDIYDNKIVLRYDLIYFGFKEVELPSELLERKLNTWIKAIESFSFDMKIGDLSLYELSLINKEKKLNNIIETKNLFLFLEQDNQHCDLILINSYKIKLPLGYSYDLSLIKYGDEWDIRIKQLTGNYVYNDLNSEKVLEIYSNILH